MHQRLFEIVWLLSEQEGVTAGQLAERFGVSRRTIYRDVDALSGAGVPVYSEKGKGGGIRLLPGFVLDKAVLSKEERTQLTAHLHSLDSLGVPDTKATLDKLAAMFGSTEAWLQVDYAPWAAGDEARAVFRLLRQAVLGRQVIEFEYMGGTGQTTTRQVEPQRVMFRGQGWYLHGWCRTRCDHRFFKLNRMSGVAPTGEMFDPTLHPAPQQAQPYTGDVCHVKLKLASGLAFRAVDEFGPHQRTKTPDGGYIVEADFPFGSWLLGYLLSFGPGVQVLQPQSLREELCDCLQMMLDANREPDVEPSN